MDEDQQIDAGARIAAFLGDETVQKAITRLGDRYVEEWKSGQTPEEREAAWGKRRALDDLKLELQAVVDSGFRANVEKTRRERATPRRH